MNDEKYERGYHEFFCPICRATIVQDYFYREYERGTFDYAKNELDKQELYGRYITEHFRDIHGVDFPERKNNDNDETDDNDETN